MIGGIFKKLTALVLLTVMLLGLCSCDREYDEEQVRAAAAALIQKSEFLNEIYYGKGIPYIDDEEYASGSYYKADMSYCRVNGIETVDALKVLTREVFSTELSNGMISTKLSALYDSDGVIKGLVRYFDYLPEEEDEPSYIMVYKNAEVFLKDKVTYDYSTLRVLESDEEIVYVEISARIETDDSKVQQRTLKIGLIEEARGWRLDTPTYLRYADMDKYNDLQNK